MSEEEELYRRVDVSEARLTILVLVALLMLSSTFYVGVYVGKTTAAQSRENVTRLLPAPSATPTSFPVAAVTPVPPSRTPIEVTDELPPGFIGPPPLVRRETGTIARGAVLKGFSIEVLVVRDMDMAMDTRRRLMRAGYPAYVAPAAGNGGEVRYRVLVGDFASEEEAKRTLEKLESSEGLRGRLAR